MRSAPAQTKEPEEGLGTRPPDGELSDTDTLQEDPPEKGNGTRSSQTRSPENEPSQKGRAAAQKKYTRVECGEASYYGAELAGNRTANGEIFQPHLLTAAHKTLAFGTEVIAVPGTAAPDENTLKKVQVRINDRGPYAPGRIIDLSTAAFQKLAPLGSGILNVCIYTLQ